ncbi:uncharacterized protein LOC108673212 [Hyalella azteca]|uniref:Uncharacterized protein LOC108673212 n=1 Tax=Hyalella azteca TaxID=294128 RepID=A0A8B7NS10_HYAAZ|nr:uncharacterized protein LOC108673212 [Hyalella azteca]
MGDFKKSPTELPAPEIDSSALAYINSWQTPGNLTFEGVIQSDPCNLIRGFKVTLTNSSKGYNDTVIEVPKQDTFLVLDCKTVDVFQTLRTTALTVDGKELTPNFPSFDPVSTNDDYSKIYDRTIQSCLYSMGGASISSFNNTDFCASRGLRTFGEELYLKSLAAPGVLNESFLVDLKFYPASGEWKWTSSMNVLPFNASHWWSGYMQPTTKWCATYNRATLQLADLSCSSGASVACVG